MKRANFSKLNCIARKRNKRVSICLSKCRRNKEKKEINKLSTTNVDLNLRTPTLNLKGNKEVSRITISRLSQTNIVVTLISAREKKRKWSSKIIVKIEIPYEKKFFELQLHFNSFYNNLAKLIILRSKGKFAYSYLPPGVTLLIHDGNYRDAP